MKKIIRTTLSCTVAVIALTNCTPTTAQRGNLLQDYQISEVAPGTHTRSDVLRLLGSPTTQAPFDENIWYYLGQTTEKKGIFDPKVVEERIIVVAFDEEGVVQNIEDIDPNRLNIPVSEERTPTHGTNLTLMQQLLGNLGRFNPPAPE